MRTSVMRAVLLGATALALSFGAAGCGGDSGADKPALVNKLKAEEDFKGMPGNVLDCMADVALKYGDKDDIKGLGPHDKAADPDTEKCAKMAAQ